MDFLTICKRVNDIVGFQGVITSVSATGYQSVLIQAVKDAYTDIQRYRTDWDFMRGTKQVNVGSTAEYYTLDTLWGTGNTPDLAEWNYIMYDNRRLVQYSYDAYQYLDFEEYSPEKPQLYAIDPVTKGLYINPVDTVYTLDIYYVKTLDHLSTNSSVPRIPERFHQAIVYAAVMNLSTFVGNPTYYDTYSLKYAQILGQLMREENPPKYVRKRPVA